MTDMAGNSTTYRYDEFGRVWQECSYGGDGGNPGLADDTPLYKVQLTYANFGGASGGSCGSCGGG